MKTNGMNLSRRNFIGGVGAFGALPSVLDDFGGRFDRRYVTLLPGKHVFTYRPGGKLDEATARRNFRLDHLQGARK